MNSANISFVLVRPSVAGNVGAAARALKNFGFSQLRIVDPQINFRESEDQWLAVSAYDLIEKALQYATLDDALKDVNFAVATSSGRDRSAQTQTVREALGEISTISQKNKIAVVFGNEQNGLTGEELDRCHSVMRVPTTPAFPVMNLAQTVAVVAYELGFATTSGAHPVGDYLRPTGEQDDELFRQLDSLCYNVKFTRDYNREVVVSEIRQAYYRMKPSERENALMRAALYKINSWLGFSDETEGG